MVVMFEIAPPFRWTPKVERVGPLTRWIWAWFSLAYLSGKFGRVWEAIRQDERQKCWDEINAAIPNGPLTGNGWDESSVRNGLVLASNIVMDGLYEARKDLS